MNKLNSKNPDDLKTGIDQLIVLEGKDKLIRSTAKVEEQSFNQLKMPSKYATILTCSFEKDRIISSKVKMFP
jgi:hypothetical protein